MDPDRTERIACPGSPYRNAASTGLQKYRGPQTVDAVRQKTSSEPVLLRVNTHSNGHSNRLSDSHLNHELDKPTCPVRDTCIIVYYTCIISAPCKAQWRNIPRIFKLRNLYFDFIYSIFDIVTLN